VNLGKELQEKYITQNALGRSRKEKDKMKKKFRYGICQHCGKKGVYIEDRDYVTKYDKKRKCPQYTHYRCKYCGSRFTQS